jgi:hypothetical protein
MPYRETSVSSPGVAMRLDVCRYATITCTGRLGQAQRFDQGTKRLGRLFLNDCFVIRALVLGRSVARVGRSSRVLKSH